MRFIVYIALIIGLELVCWQPKSTFLCFSLIEVHQNGACLATTAPDLTLRLHFLNPHSDRLKKYLW